MQPLVMFDVDAVPEGCTESAVSFCVRPIKFNIHTKHVVVCTIR